MGVARSGRFGIVTNFRDLEAPPAPDAPSRGDLVTRFLTGATSPKEYLDDLRGRAPRYAGFSLLLGGPRALYYFTNRNGHGTRDCCRRASTGSAITGSIRPGRSCCVRAPGSRNSSGTIQSNPQRCSTCWPTVRRPTTDEIPETGLPPDWERALSAPFVVHERYGTRCSTLLLVERNGHTTMLERRFDEAGALTGVVAHRSSTAWTCPSAGSTTTTRRTRRCRQRARCTSRSTRRPNDVLPHPRRTTLAALAAAALAVRAGRLPPRASAAPKEHIEHPHRWRAGRDGRQRARVPDVDAVHRARRTSRTRRCAASPIAPSTRRPMRCALSAITSRSSRAAPAATNRTGSCGCRIAAGRTRAHAETSTCRSTGPARTTVNSVAFAGNSTLKPGTRLDHTAYESLKTSLMRTARDRGYLDATLTRRELIVNPTELTADARHHARNRRPLRIRRDRDRAGRRSTTTCCKASCASPRASRTRPR